MSISNTTVLGTHNITQAPLWQGNKRFPSHNPSKTKAVFIDRDGVICRNRKDHVKNWQEFVFLPGAIQALTELAQSTLRIIIITNQAIINRGMVPEATVKDIHTRMVSHIHAAGGRIDQVYYCPHRTDEHCGCRKPQPGLLTKAAQDFNIDLENSYLIGDAETDLMAGEAAGCKKRFLVLTGRGKRQLINCWQHQRKEFILVPNLGTAINNVLKEQATALYGSVQFYGSQRSYVHR